MIDCLSDLQPFIPRAVPSGNIPSLGMAQASQAQELQQLQWLYEALAALCSIEHATLCLKPVNRR